MPFQISLHAAIALVVFAGVSVVIGAAMAGAGGWRALAARYPAPETTEGQEEERYRFASLRTGGGLLGTATYKNCVTVGVSGRGISLALWGPFSLFHPPLFIPWEAVESCRATEVYGNHTTRLTVRHGESLTVDGKAATAIAAAIAAAIARRKPREPAC